MHRIYTRIFFIVTFVFGSQLVMAQNTSVDPALENIFNNKPPKEYTIAGITGFGEEVLQMLDTVEMDIILMDIGLSGKMDGIETAQKIREKKEIPVVFLTANTDHATFQRAKETQPYGYIHKPFDIMQIQASVEMAIARFEVEKSLNEQRTWLSTTLSSIGDGVIATDEYGAVKFMNAVAEKLTGYTQAEAAGRQLPEIFRIINEATREVVTNPVEIVLKERHTVGLANHTILIAKDGTEYNIDDAAAPIYDANSVITGVVLTFRDITEKYQTEARLAAPEPAALHAQLDRAQQIGDGAAGGVVLDEARQRAAGVHLAAVGDQGLLGGDRVEAVFAVGLSDAVVGNGVIQLPA